MAKSTKKPPLVDEWVPKEKDNIIKYDGKLMIIPFDKIFNNDITILNSFIIKKDSYTKRLPMLCHYLNYFLKYYDTDGEILLSYLKLKYIIDDKKAKFNPSSFITIMYNILFTESVQQKVIAMVEDNYYIDLSSKDGVKYNESLEFTVEHAKVMMQISISMRIIVPILFHYLNTYGKIKEKKYIFHFYEDLFDMYGGKINIYNKLHISVWSKVNVNHIRNKIIWDQREVFGTDPLTYMDELLKEMIISEIMSQYTFDKNIISFNSVILDKQLGFFLSEQYDQNRIELSAKKDMVTGLSDLDKLEMNSSKIDEGIMILSELNIKNTIKRIEKKHNIKIKNKEINYYKDHLSINKFNVELVYYHYAKYFGGYRDLNFINKRQYIKLLLILKKKLQYDGYVYLPQILSANIESKLNTRTIQNNKFLSKTETSDIYQSIEDKYYSTEIGKKGSLILNILSTILNTVFTFVDYDNKEMIGLPIEINQDIVSDEVSSYINRI